MQYGFIELDACLFTNKLLREWQPKIIAFARRVKVNVDTEDLTQELLLHFIEISRKYKLGKSEFSTFVWTCLKNKVRNIIKEARQPVPAISPEAFSWESVEFNLNLSLTLGLKRKHKFILQALKMGYKKKEIAHRMKVTPSRITQLIDEIQNLFKTRIFYEEGFF